MKRMVLAIVVLLTLGSTAYAQLRGMGRIQGSVVDDAGAPLTEVKIRATLPDYQGGVDSSTDKKGEWIIGGLGRGDWDVVFEKAGYAPRRAKIRIEVELARVPAIAVTLKKAP